MLQLFAALVKIIILLVFGSNTRFLITFMLELILYVSLILFISYTDCSALINSCI